MDDIIDKKTWFVDFSDIKQGVWLYICRSRFHSLPLGFVWGMALGKTFFIFGMYTPNFSKRKGVATFICKYILNNFKSLMTQSGSKEGGEEFLKKFGFKKDKNMDWIYINERKK